MTKKKKKKNYIDFEADAGQGFENFDKPPTRINVFDRARKIKTWNMFIHLVEQENITPADEIYLSNSTFLSLRKQNINTAYIGEYSFKGFENKEKVYKIFLKHNKIICKDKENVSNQNKIE